MLSKFTRCEKIARKAHAFDSRTEQERQVLHPFDLRNIHPRLHPISRALFDDGHYAQATFEAFKFVDKEIQRFSGISESGYKLFMRAFAENSPAILLTKMSNTSEKDEQEGYKFMFAGSALAIRNPRGHEYNIKDDPDNSFHHLILASL